MRVVGALFRRAVGLSWSGGGALMPLAFLVITITLLPLTVGSALTQLQALAPGYIILTLALSTLLGLESLFARELDSGALDLFAPGPLPLAVTVVVLLGAHVLATGIPLVLVAPFLGILLGVSPFKAAAFVVPAMLAAVAFAMVGAIGAALSVLSRRSGLLMAVIALPLYVPIAIFASAAASGQPGALNLLGAYTLFAGALSPFAAAAALKLARE